MDWLAIASLGIAACGCAYALAAFAVVRRFGRESEDAPSKALPGVTLLKPLYGAESNLHANLATFCDQNYGGPLQVLFGVHSIDDPAVPIVERLIRDHPEDALDLVVSNSVRAANPKVANLTAMQEHIRHDIVIISDSDVVVRKDYVAKTIATLERPGVGLVTCLYHGISKRRMPARFAAMAIDYHFLPNVLVGKALGLARPCFGATIALRRRTLIRIGGFGAFREQLADDNAIGEAVRATGLEVAVAPFVVGHRCSERSMVELLRHEIRWARTIRAVSPAGYAGSIITYPLPFALVGAFATGSLIAGAACAMVAIACRLALQVQVDRTLGVCLNRWWLGPARDLLSFAVHIAGFFVNVVSWRGKRFQVYPDGTLVPVRKSTP